jgi:hypothetical protein
VESPGEALQSPTKEIAVTCIPPDRAREVMVLRAGAAVPWAGWALREDTAEVFIDGVHDGVLAGSVKLEETGVPLF